MGNSDVFWSGAPRDLILHQIIKGSVPTWKQPIHLVLKDVILTEGIDSLKARYRQLQASQPDNYNFRVGFLDQLGYWLIDRDQALRALEVFQFQVELEPEDSGWPDSVADAYRAMGNLQQAKLWYQKALEMNPEQGFSKRKLAELRGAKDD